MRAVPKRGAPKTKKNRNRTPPIMGFVRDTAIGSTAPNSPPDSGSAWRSQKQAKARPVPPSPLFPNKARAGPHLDLRSHLGSARRVQIRAQRLQSRFGRCVAKRARVIFEIMTWRRIISEHSNLREGKDFTPKPHRCLHLHTQDLLVLSFSCVARYWRASSKTSGGATSSTRLIS